MALGFDLNCPEFMSDGLITGVKRAVLIFNCGKGRTGELNERTGYPGGRAFDNAKFTPLSVDETKPSWRAEATGEAAIGLVGAVPADFIRIFNLTPGGHVTATVMAHLKDVRTTFSIPLGQEENIAKQKIKKRLREMKICSDQSGEAVLAKDVIYFVAREG